MIVQSSSGPVALYKRHMRQIIKECPLFSYCVRRADLKKALRSCGMVRLWLDHRKYHCRRMCRERAVKVTLNSTTPLDIGCVSFAPSDATKVIAWAMRMR